MLIRIKKVEMEVVTKRVKRKITRKKRANIRKEKKLTVIVQVNGVISFTITRTIIKIAAIII